jgi:hypothetical protein
MYFLLGEKQKYQTEGETLLENICLRYNLIKDKHYKLYYCYAAQPRGRAVARPRESARHNLMKMWLTDVNPIIVGFGWIACDTLFEVGRSRLKTKVGCKWRIKDYEQNWAWQSYDISAALFDPNLIVDISGVIVTAAKEDGHKITVNKSIKPYHWKNI